MSRSNQALRRGKSTLREGKAWARAPRPSLGHLLFFLFLKVFFFFFLKWTIFLKKYCLFIYVWLLWVFIAATAFLSLWGAGRKHCGGFSCCGTQALGLQQLRLLGLVAPRHVGSSLTGDRTHVPCIGRQTLHHRATRGSPVRTIF